MRQKGARGKEGGACVCVCVWARSGIYGATAPRTNVAPEGAHEWVVGVVRLPREQDRHHRSLGRLLRAYQLKQKVQLQRVTHAVQRVLRGGVEVELLKGVRFAVHLPPRIQRVVDAVAQPELEARVEVGARRH